MSPPSHRAAPERNQLPAVQRMRVQFAKRGRLRFTSHRDFQRAFERALRRAAVPMAYSHGFTPHPKLSFVGAAPTGAASEAEFLEISLTEERDPEQIKAVLDAALPPGLDIVGVAVVDPPQKDALADRLTASSWQIEFPEAAPDDVASALEAFLAAESVEVKRLTKKGTRSIDARQAVLHAELAATDPLPTLRCLLEHQTPTVRPEEILAGLQVVAGFTPPAPPRATRLAQGSWDAERRELLPLEL